MGIGPSSDFMGSTRAFTQQVAANYNQRAADSNAAEAAATAATGVTSGEAQAWLNTPEGRAWKAEFDKTIVSVPGESVWVAMGRYTEPARIAAGAAKKAKDDAYAARIRASPCVISTRTGDWEAIDIVNQPGKYKKSYLFTGACEEPYDKITAETKQDCVGTWSAWDVKDCGTQNKKNRTFTVVKEPTANGEACPTYRTDTVACNTQGKKDCFMSSWSEWSSCNPQTLTRTRTRTVITEPTWDGIACPTERTQTETNCFENCRGEWSLWAPIDCADGTLQTSIYNIVQPAIGTGAACPFNGGQSQNRTCQRNLGIVPTQIPTISATTPPGSTETPTLPGSTATPPPLGSTATPTPPPTPSTSTATPTPTPSTSDETPTPSTPDSSPPSSRKSLSTMTIILIIIGFLIAIGAIVLSVM